MSFVQLDDTNNTSLWPNCFFYWRSFCLFPWEKLQLWAGPSRWQSAGSSQRAGMSRSVGWMAACTFLSVQLVGAPESLLARKAKVVVFPRGGRSEQPQCGFSNALLQILRLLRLQRDDPQPGKALKTTPTGLPSRRYASLMASSWGLLEHSPADVPDLGLVEELKKLGVHLPSEMKDQDSK